jgi:proteic killer suppression protein
MSTSAWPSVPLDALRVAYYIPSVIRSVRGSPTQAFIEQGKARQFSGLDAEIARRRIAALDSATSLAELGRLQSIGLHKLKGPLRNFWSININGRWRLLFRFKDGDAFEVHIVDPH